MTNSFIAIKGEHLNKAEDIFQTFKYSDTCRDRQFTDWESFDNYLLDNYFEFAENEIVLRGIWCANDWTIISDPEMVDILAEDALTELSERLNAFVITFIIQSNSGSFGFAVYNGSPQRIFFTADGKIITNLFEPLNEEKDLNINENVFSDDILMLAGNFGIYLNGQEDKVYIVKQLVYRKGNKKEILEVNKQTQQNRNKKPWWKIW